MGERSLSSTEQDPIEHFTMTRVSKLIEEQRQIKQSTVTGDQALGKEQGQIEQFTVTGDPASGEEQMVQSTAATGDHLLHVYLNLFTSITDIWVAVFNFEDHIIHCIEI